MSNEPKCLINNLGDKYWVLKGKLHREDGPALEQTRGSKTWYLKGKRHRVDGPAVEWANGYKAWYLNGRKFENQTEWFDLLTPKQQENYLWNLDEG